jgi:hypothetical protein
MATRRTYRSPQSPREDGYHCCVAFIYLAGGQALRVPASREAIVNDLLAAGPGKTLEYEVDFPALGATQPAKVTVLAENITAVSDQPLPNPLR